MATSARRQAQETTEVDRVLAIVGGRAPRARGKAGLLRLHDAVEQKLDVSAFDRLAKWLLIPTAELLETLALSQRTLARRRLEGALSPEESDRALRVARVAARAEDVLGGHEEATSWIKRANRALGGHAPLALLRTDAGASLVVDALTRIEHGVFA